MARVEMGRRSANHVEQQKDYGWTLYLIIITLLMVLGFFVSSDKLYRSGDKVGYDMGLVGGLMMLTLLFYPIRKRIRFMRGWGQLPKWFKWHMIFGIFGPALIVFHSTFHIGSINAGVAMTCMLLVSGSGIFGRFFYTKIHYGLYGREASLNQLQSELGGAGDVKSIFAFAPKIQERLVKFRDAAVKTSIDAKGKLNLLNFLTIGLRVKMLKMLLVFKLKRVMYVEVKKNKLDRSLVRRVDQMFQENRQFIEDYLKSVQEVAQFNTYERLFALWHVFHVPLVYMLVFSSIWHVIAVHMY